MAPDGDYSLFDPALDAPTDPAALQGLVHPLRLQLLGQLRQHGAATATQLAGALHVSSALASYHLRQLHASGFILEAEEEEVADRRRGGRERWWRAARRSTWVRSTGGGEAAEAIVRDYLGVVLEAMIGNARAWLDVEPEWPDEWQHLDDFSDLQLALTPEEARQFEGELGKLLARYRRHDPATALPEGGAIVTFQYQLYPEARQAVPGVLGD